MSRQDYDRVLEAVKADLMKKFDKRQLAVLLAGYMVAVETNPLPRPLKEYHENAKRITGMGAQDLDPAKSKSC